MSRRERWPLWQWRYAALAIVVGTVLLSAAGGGVDRPALGLRALAVVVLASALAAMPRTARSVEDPVSLGTWSRVDRWTLAAVVAMSAIVRIGLAATEPMHYDEAFSANRYVRGTVGSILTTYDAPNNHILNSLLEKVSTAAFGEAELAFRLPAVLAGIGVVMATAWLAALLRGPRAAILAAGLAAAAPPLVAYSANGRGYGIVALGTLLGLIGAFHVAQGDERRRWWSLLAVSCVVSLLAIPSAALSVVGIYGWLVIVLTIRRRWTGRAVAGIALTGMLIGLVTLDIYLPIRDQPGFDYAWLPTTTVAELIRHTATAWTAGIGLPIGILVAILFVAGVVLPLGPHGMWPERAAIVVFALVIPVVAMTAAGKLSPFSRSYISLLPLMLALAATVVGALLERNPSGSPQPRALQLVIGAAGIGLALMPLLHVSPRAWDEDARQLADVGEVMDTVRANAPTPLLTNWIAGPTMEFYTRRDRLHLPPMIGGASPETDRFFLAVTPPQTPAAILKLAAIDAKQFRTSRRWHVGRSDVLLMVRATPAPAAPAATAQQP